MDLLECADTPGCSPTDSQRSDLVERTGGFDVNDLNESRVSLDCLAVQNLRHTAGHGACQIPITAYCSRSGCSAGCFPELTNAHDFSPNGMSCSICCIYSIYPRYSM